MSYFYVRYQDANLNMLLAKACILDRRYEYAPPTSKWPSLDLVKEDLIRDVAKKVDQSRAEAESGSSSSSKVTVGKLIFILYRVA